MNSFNVLTKTVNESTKLLKLFTEVLSQLLLYLERKVVTNNYISKYITFPVSETLNPLLYGDKYKNPSSIVKNLAQHLQV